MRKFDGGFTLVEALIAMAFLVTGIVLAGMFIQSLISLNPFTEELLTAQQDLQQFFARIVTEIRSASQANTGAYPIKAAATSTFVFYSDYDQDGLFEEIRYFLDGSVLKKGIIKPTGNPLSYSTSSEIISAAVENVVIGGDIFQYYDSAFTGSEPPLSYPINLGDIRSVKVTLTVDLNPSAAPQPVTFSDLITIRNLRSN